MKNTRLCNWRYHESRTPGRSFLEAAASANCGGQVAAEANEAECALFIIWHTTDEEILFLLAYPKNEKDDLSRDEIKQLKRLVDEFVL